MRRSVANARPHLSVREPRRKNDTRSGRGARILSQILPDVQISASGPLWTDRERHQFPDGCGQRRLGVARVRTT
jgi:hypothetical protein